MYGIQPLLYLFLPEAIEKRMKISELSSRTHIPKETIHFYVREGLIPRPRKRGKNVADYDESYIERILLIKEIQDHFFLPLSLIKAIIKRHYKSPELKAMLKLRMGYFSPLDQLLEKGAVGEEAFAKATGMGKKWIGRFAEWGVITPETRDGERIYSQDDVILGRLMVDLDRAGFGPKDGVDPSVLKNYIKMYKQIVRMAHESFLDTHPDQLTSEETLAKGIRGRELMGVFFYHLYRKLAREEEDLSVAKKKPDSLLEKGNGRKGKARK
jgi:DNA-binding transcriptional MerR regulator